MKNNKWTKHHTKLGMLHSEDGASPLFFRLNQSISAGLKEIAYREQEYKGLQLEFRDYDRFYFWMAAFICEFAGTKD